MTNYTERFVKYKGQDVRIRFAIDEEHNVMHISCRTKTDELFGKIKTVLKEKMGYRFDNQSKFWSGDKDKGIEFLEKFGIDPNDGSDDL